MAVFNSGGVWWCKFYFAGRFICEAPKSTSKTMAKGPAGHVRFLGFGKNAEKDLSSGDRPYTVIAGKTTWEFRLRAPWATGARHQPKKVEPKRKKHSGCGGSAAGRSGSVDCGPQRGPHSF